METSHEQNEIVAIFQYNTAFYVGVPPTLSYGKMMYTQTSHILTGF